MTGLEHLLPMRRAGILLTVGLALALAGCTSGGVSETSTEDAWRYDAGGQGNANADGTLEVPDGQAEASMSIGGQADATLTVRDADEAIVLEMRCSGSGGCSKQAATDPGTPGTWTANLQGLYNGGISVAVEN